MQLFSACVCVSELTVRGMESYVFIHKHRERQPSPEQLDPHCGFMYILFFSAAVLASLCTHVTHSPTHTAAVIRPLIFPSLPGSPGVISNRAALTSPGSCSSHRGSPLISIDFFFFLFFCCFTHKNSPAEDNISELSPGSNVSLSQSGRLYNYTGQRRAIQFFTRSSLLPLSLCRSFHLLLCLFLPSCCQAGSISLNQTPSSNCVQLITATDSCHGLVVITTRRPLEKIQL